MPIIPTRPRARSAATGPAARHRGSASRRDGGAERQRALLPVRPSTAGQGPDRRPGGSRRRRRSPCQPARPGLLPLTPWREPMHHANLEKLKRLFGMVRALQELTGLDDRLDFDDQLALLIERETADRTNAALEMRLKRARLRQCFENLDLKASLDKGLIRDLFTCRWISQHRHVILTGATGTGKTWIACALGNQAAREGFSVLYTRLSPHHSTQVRLI